MLEERLLYCSWTFIWFDERLHWIERRFEESGEHEALARETYDGKVTTNNGLASYAAIGIVNFTVIVVAE